MTRLYLPPTRALPAAWITPAPDAEWENQASFDRVIMSPTKSNTAFASTTATADATATANRDVIRKQYIFPLPAGVVFSTSDTIKGRVLASESNGALNARSQFIARVIASDGSTLRATLYAGDLTTGTSNPTSEFATALTNRQMPRGSSVAVAANYTTVAGDYLVCEVGWRKHSTDTTRTVTMRFGDNNASDLAENETATTDANTWIEFSTDLLAPLADAAGNTISSDTFTDTAGVTLGTHDASWNAVGTSSMVISDANRARASTSTSHFYAHDDPVISDQYDIHATLHFITDNNLAQAGLLGRLDDSADTIAGHDGYRFVYNSNGDTYSLLRITDNTGTILMSYTRGYPGDGTSEAIEIRLRDGYIACYVAGVLQLFSNDLTYTAAGKPGIMVNNNNHTNTAGVHLDDFSVVDVDSAPVDITIQAPPATGSGAAPAPVLRITLASPPGLGDGTAPAPVLWATTAAPPGTGSGAAVAPVSRMTVPAPAALGSGAAPVPVAYQFIGVSAPPALGSGTAPAPVPVVVVAAPPGLGSGAAPSPVLRVVLAAPPGLGSGIAVAPVSRMTLAVPAGFGSGVAVAPVSRMTLAVPAALGSGIAVAPVLRATLAAPPGLGTGAAVAPASRLLSSVPAGLGTGTAPAPALAGRWLVPAATGLGDAPAPEVVIPGADITVQAPPARGDGSAPAPLAITVLSVPPALGAGTAPPPTARALAAVPAAQGQGAAPPPVVVLSLAVPPATGSGAAPAPVLAVLAEVPAGDGLGVALVPVFYQGQLVTFLPIFVGTAQGLAQGSRGQAYQTGTALQLAQRARAQGRER